MVCKITQEKDLGVTVDSLVETSTQCTVVVKKANKMSGYVKDGLESNTEIRIPSNTLIKYFSF